MFYLTLNHANLEKPVGKVTLAEILRARRAQFLRHRSHALHQLLHLQDPVFVLLSLSCSKAFLKFREGIINILRIIFKDWLLYRIWISLNCSCLDLTGHCSRSFFLLKL